jgi:hypothetical protein
LESKYLAAECLARFHVTGLRFTKDFSGTALYSSGGLYDCNGAMILLSFLLLNVLVAIEVN